MTALMATAAARLACLGGQQITQILSDRCARAFLLEGVPQQMALEANAHLVTELRLARVWPAPCPGARGDDEDDGG